MDSRIKIEQKQKSLYRENKELINEFTNYLADSSPRVQKHAIENADDFLNEFLANNYAENYLDGVGRLEEYFGSYCINKLVLTSETAMRLATGDIKKLYKFLYDSGRISKELCDAVCYDIKLGLADWIDDLDNSFILRPDI